MKRSEEDPFVGLSIDTNGKIKTMLEDKPIAKEKIKHVKRDKATTEIFLGKLEE